MSKLLRNFALASAVAIVVATAILIVVYENIAKSDMIASVEQQNVFLGKSIANSIWPQFEGFLRTFADADALRSRPEIQALNEALLLLTKNLPVLRVKSYNLDGLTVYSSEASQIGSDGHENPRLRFVLDESLPASEQAYKQEFTAFRGIVFDRDLVETYVPITSEDGSVEAVFELYTDVTPLITGIDRTVANLLIVLTGVFVALYVALFLIVRRGDGIIHRETASRRQVEMQLMQFQKVESLGMAHNLNNLLYPIATLSSRTRDELPADSRGRERLDKVLEACERATTIVGQVLRFSYKSELTEEPIDIGACVRSSLDLMLSTIPSNVTLIDALDQTTGAVRADPAQIITILMNLASNATDAMNDMTGEIVISLARADVDAALSDSLINMKPGPYAKLTIRDTGHGMDDDTKQKIFDPFFTTKLVENGTGLGLSSVFGIVSSLGGTIDVTSAPGAGTSIDVYLPLVDAPE